MKKKRPIKKTSKPSTRSSSTQPPAGRVIQSGDDLLQRSRQTSSNGRRVQQTTKPSKPKQQPQSKKATPKVKAKPRKRGLSRRMKRRCRLLFQTSVFLGVILTLLVVSYDFVEGYFDERTKNQELVSEQIIPIHDLQLELNEALTLKFFIETEGEGDASQLVTVKFPKGNVKLKKRNSVPYPYLKANCPKDNRSCKLEEASNFTLYLKEEDIQGIQIP